MLCAVYACSQLDRQIMGILLEPIKQDLGATDTQMGFLVGLAFAVFYTFLAIPIAVVADKGYRRNIIAASIIVWSAMTAVCGLVNTYTQMAFARIGVAVGEAGSSPASVSIISSLFDEKRRATAMGVFAMGGSIGVLLAFLGGGLLLDNFGWRITFFVVAIPGVILGLMVLFVVREPDVPPKTSPEDEPSVWTTTRHMAKSRPLRHLLAGNALAGFVGYGTVLWTPAFLVRTHGLSGTEIGLTLAVFAGIGGAIGTMMSGRVTDYLGRFDERWRSWSIAVVKVALIPFSIAWFMIDNYWLALCFYAVPAVLGSFYLAPSTAMIQNLVRPRMRAVASAISIFLLNIVGMGLGPQGVGILSDLLGPTFGADSLRYTLCIFLFVNLWAAFHFWMAGNHMGSPKEAMERAVG
nr:MFS transporter [uncultured Parasphingorhabdus sp.]